MYFLVLLWSVLQYMFSWGCSYSVVLHLLSSLILPYILPKQVVMEEAVTKIPNVVEAHCVVLKGSGGLYSFKTFTNFTGQLQQTAQLFELHPLDLRH